MIGSTTTDRCGRYGQCFPTWTKTGRDSDLRRLSKQRTRKPATVIGVQCHDHVTGIEYGFEIKLELCQHTRTWTYKTVCKNDRGGLGLDDRSRVIYTEYVKTHVRPSPIRMIFEEVSGLALYEAIAMATATELVQARVG